MVRVVFHSGRGQRERKDEGEFLGHCEIGTEWGLQCWAVFTVVWACVVVVMVAYMGKERKCPNVG